MTTSATHPTQEALHDALERMNEAGERPELAAVDANGAPFLATLGDEGDSAAFVVITSDDDGWPTGRHPCDECGASGPLDWAPRYPVTTLRGGA
jgi:hypothetical protein